MIWREGVGEGEGVGGWSSIRGGGVGAGGGSRNHTRSDGGGER